MKKLDLFVCENFYPQFAEILKDKEFQDFNIVTYPTLCDHKNKKETVTQIFQTSNETLNDGVLICSKYCGALNCTPKDKKLETIVSDYCFSHLINDSMITYIVQKGGYLVSDGWLRNWKERLESEGFNQTSARQFYKESCKELIYLNSEINPDFEKNLNDLSNYLDIPSVILPFETFSLKALLKSVLYRWKLSSSNSESKLKITELRSQNAEYSAMFDIVNRISTYTNKRETIEVIKEMFISIFGAQRFTFWVSGSDTITLPVELEHFIQEPETVYQLFESSNRFCISVRYNARLYGIFDVGDFLFPKYIEHYLNLALEISKVCALVLSNIERYELLQKSEMKFENLSFHDALTGLKNRSYLNDFISKNKAIKNCTVYAFDIDRLKYVNDTFGHAEGDHLICLASEVLKECFRESDIIARVGGDEFVAIVMNSETTSDELFLSRIDEAISSKNKRLVNKLWRLEMSRGSSSNTNNERQIESLILEADQKMYINKNEKKLIREVE